VAGRLSEGLMSCNEGSLHREEVCSGLLFCICNVYTLTWVLRGDVKSPLNWSEA
jgi:hypothetical protein